MKLTTILKKSIIQAAVGGILAIPTLSQAQEVTLNSPLNTGDYTIILETTNDQPITGFLTSNGKDSKDHEGFTVGVNTQFTKQYPNKKVHAGAHSALYQRAIADRKLGNYYRSLSLSKSEIYAGIETNPNNNNISHTGLILIHQLQSGKSHMTKLRDWYHNVWDAAEFKTYIDDLKQEAIGLSYEANYNFEKEIKTNWNVLAKGSAGFDIYTSTSYEEPEYIDLEIKDKNFSFNYLSNLNTKAQLLINYIKNGKEKFSIEANITFKKYFDINFDELNTNTNNILKKGTQTKYYNIQLQTPSNHDINYGVTLNAKLFTTPHFDLSLRLGLRKELSRENIIFSIEKNPQKTYVTGFKANVKHNKTNCNKKLLF